ncbi:hypothetical protein IR083_07560 [Dysgonomonas sp. GY75]|uniref:hypothetical protein n=1 Tax=Dysgonomonas sp. GY75 TaxID=2780419 RepID=UPI001883776A|nr:hypothetical protein [Dysgonomonas sp. GY75]MBF0648673.1 hypothetical protein [Dysgonomonas sp. GY75]
MAKKITNPEDPGKDESIDTQSGIKPEPEVQTGIPAKPGKEAVIEDINEMPPHIAGILKKNTKYESLYIDSHGGCFTPDTPAGIRGSAILYKNPFHKQ